MRSPKSGNFWLYKILQQVLAKTRRSTVSFIEQHPIYAIARQWKLNIPEQARIDVLEITDLQYSYRISSIFRMPVDDIRDYTSRAPHVWTHSPVCKKSEELFDLFSKKVYIIRDPRDRALSAARYYCSDYMLKYFPQEETNPQRFLDKNFDALMQEWVWHVFDHLQLSQSHKIHIVFFEAFLMHFQQALERLLSYLEIHLENGQREALEEAVSFRQLQQKNPDHLKKGESGYWMHHLTDEQVERVEIIAGPLIRYLGYPAERHQPTHLLPKINPEDMEGLKKDILHSQKQINQN